MQSKLRKGGAVEESQIRIGESLRVYGKLLLGWYF